MVNNCKCFSGSLDRVFEEIGGDIWGDFLGLTDRTCTAFDLNSSANLWASLTRRSVGGAYFPTTIITQLTLWFNRQMWQGTVFSPSSSSARYFVAASTSFDHNVFYSRLRLSTAFFPPLPLPLCPPPCDVDSAQLYLPQRMLSAVKLDNRIFFCARTNGQMLLVFFFFLQSPFSLKCCCRNPKASTSSRYISLLPSVAWHCRPDPPSTRMVSTTVSTTILFLFFCLVILVSHCICLLFCFFLSA